MLLISALTDVHSEIKAQPCSNVGIDGGTTLHPPTPFERAVHKKGLHSHRVQVQISGLSVFSRVQKVFIIGSSR